MKTFNTTLLILTMVIVSTTVIAQKPNLPPQNTKEVIGSGGFKILNVNHIRNYTLNASTLITIDGISQGIIPFEVIGSGGYKIRFKVASDVNPTISQGTLSELHLISDIKGPITSLNPLKVLNQAVFATSDTQLVNISEISSSTLNVGDDVSVSGAIDAVNNSIQLSRLEKNNPALSEWQLRGFVKNITASTFMIGNLVINTNSVVPTPMGCNLINNAFVSIKATAVNNFNSNLPLATLTSITCEVPDVDQTPNFSVPSVVEGVISDVLSFDSFKINDLIVLTDINTEFDNGELEHIDVGSKVEVQGLLNTITREMTASSVRFIHHRIKIIAPATPTDITNNSITLLNKTILATPLTQDNDLLLTNGISTNRQIEVRGFIDSTGQMYALRIRNRDTADTQQIKLRGDVTAINKPMLAINGILIDASASEFQQVSGVVNFDINTFFNSLAVGMQASIQAAHYDATTQMLSMGSIKISEQELVDNPDSTVKSLSAVNIKEVIGSGGFGFATITVPDAMFNSGFE